MGCGEGLFFMQYYDLRFELLEEKIFFGKYVTQLCPVSATGYLVSIWNQPGLWLCERRPGCKPEKIEDPRYNSHTTDIKPLFPDQIADFPYVVSRNRNSINLVDLRNRHTQPLIEIRNSDLFCEKLCLTIDPDTYNLRMMYVSW